MPTENEIIDYLKGQLLDEINLLTKRVEKVHHLISLKVEDLTNREKQIIYRVNFLRKHAKPFPTNVGDFLEYKSVQLEALTDLAEVCEKKAMNNPKGLEQ